MRFGIFLRKLREAHRPKPLTQPAVAEETGLSREGIGRIERIVETPDEVQGTTLVLLARAYMGPNATGDDLVARWKSNGKPVKGGSKTATTGKGIPVLGKISATGLVEMLDNRHGEADEFIPAPSIYSPDAFALRLVGTSMQPKYEPGDCVIFEPCTCDDIRAGEDVMIQLDGEGKAENAFKRSYPSPKGKGWLLLMPLNANVVPCEVECAKVIRIARAVAIHRPLTRTGR